MRPAKRSRVSLEKCRETRQTNDPLIDVGLRRVRVHRADKRERRGDAIGHVKSRIRPKTIAPAERILAKATEDERTEFQTEPLA